jgi:acetyl-CoA acyltransferase 1
MGMTSENVAKDFNISRQMQDEFADRSFQKAAAVQKAGWFKDEIVPIKTIIIDPKTEKEVEIVVDVDDGIRDGVTAVSLSKLKSSFYSCRQCLASLRWCRCSLTRSSLCGEEPCLAHRR